MRLAGLLPFPDEEPDLDFEIMLTANGPGDSAWDWSNRQLTYHRVNQGKAVEIVLGNPGCRPRVTESKFRHVDWVTPANNVIEIVSVDTDEDIYWSMCTADTRLSQKINTASTTKSAGFCAACLLTAGSIAGATNNRVIHWLKHYGIVLSPCSKPVSLKVSADIFT